MFNGFGVFDGDAIEVGVGVFDLQEVQDALAAPQKKAAEKERDDEVGEDEHGGVVGVWHENTEDDGRDADDQDSYDEDEHSLKLEIGRLLFAVADFLRAIVGANIIDRFDKLSVGHGYIIL